MIHLKTECQHIIVVQNGIYCLVQKLQKLSTFFQDSKIQTSMITALV